MVRETFKQLAVGVIGGLIPAYLVVYFPPDEVKASAKSAWEGSKGIVEVMGSSVEVPAWYLLLALLTCIFFSAGFARQIYVWASTRRSKLTRFQKTVIGFFSANHGRTYTRQQVSTLIGAPLLLTEAAIDRLLALDLLEDHLFMGVPIQYGLSEKGRAYVIDGGLK